MKDQIKQDYQIAQADIEITNICNLACSYCRGSNGKQKNLSKQTVYKILENIAQWEIPATIFNGGEPGIRKADLIDFAKFASSLGLRPGMYSNGTLIDKEFAKRISEIENYRAVISIHSLNPKKDLDKTYAGIKYLNSFGVIPEIFLLMTSKNVNNLERLIGDISENDLSKVSLLQFAPVGVGYNYKKFVLSTQNRILIHQKVKSLEGNVPFELNCAVDLTEKEALDKLRNIEPPKKVTLHINSDGMIVPFYAGAEDTVLGKAYDSAEFTEILSNPLTYEFFENAMCAFVKRSFGSVEQGTSKITKKEIEMRKLE